MKKQKSIYTEVEQKILSISKDLKTLKRRRNLYLVFSFIPLLAFLSDIFHLVNLIINHSDTSIVWLISTLLIDLIFFVYFSKCFIQYQILIKKYVLLNNPETNPLVKICNEKVNNCKVALDNDETYYVVHDYCIALRDFLEDNKELLPIETYKQAKRDLDSFWLSLTDCKLK